MIMIGLLSFFMVAFALQGVGALAVRFWVFRGDL